MVDQHAPVAISNPIWEKAMARPRTTVPWLIISNGVTGYEGPLPANKAAMMELLGKHGGQ
jgi:hypothetical protein